MNTRTHNFTIGTIIAVLLLVGAGTITAQDTNFRERALRWGGSLGFNLNEASLGYQHLHEPFPNFDKPNTDNEKINGNGTGMYAGVMVEYLSRSWWGVQIRASYDMRNATVQDIYATPQTEFITRMAYLSFEPALRIDQHLIPRLSFTAGPLIAANLTGTYDFKADVNGPVTSADMGVPDRSVVSLGASFGTAYDVEIGRGRNTSVFLSPFFDYSWIAAQRKANTTDTQNSVQDIWSTQTFRVGLRVSWETRKPVDQNAYIPPYVAPDRSAAAPVPSKNRFYAILPNGNTIQHKSVEGHFPVHPYVFFDKGSQEIPLRYTRLSKAEARDFSADDLGHFVKDENTDVQTNIDELMIVYYNILNIYGDRMRKNPNTQVTLRSSDPESWEAQTAANRIKSYLVDNFDIDANRIAIDLEEPRMESGSDQTDPAYASMIDDENRRVKMVFTNANMYSSIPYTITDESPFENDMIINIENDVRFKSWRVSVTGENRTLNAGPFYARTAALDLSPIMGDLREAEFKVAVTFSLQDGEQATESMEFKMYHGDMVGNAKRYLMVFDYNESDAVRVYESRLRNDIVAGMESGNIVYVHGHTDVIGNDLGNQTLSQARADKVKDIIVDELRGTRKDVKVIAIGIGKQQMKYTFDNSHPEGRMYNRNVFVEILK
ncbi:MAG: OmpA family protein [Bacteroidetes bacterium]|nr:OmpA family protein [Bacteroidota bacterium]